jgi:hypothetical protein
MFAQGGLQRGHLGAVRVAHAHAIGEHGIDLGRPDSGVGQRAANGERQGFGGLCPAVGVVGVRRLPGSEGGRVPGDLGEGRHPPFAGMREFLKDEHRTALAGHITARGAAERRVGNGLVAGVRKQSRLHLGDQGIRADRSLGAPAYLDRIAAPDRPAAERDRVQPPGALRTEHGTGAAESVRDRDLPGGCRVEPGDGLVGADVPRPLRPQCLDLPLAEGGSAWPCGRGYPDVKTAPREGVQGSARQRLARGQQREVGP